MIINDATLRAVDKGFQKRFMDGVGRVPTDWQKIAMKTTSKSAAEVYGDIAFFPAMRELIGEAIKKNLKEVSHTITNKEWESTVEVKQAAIERDSLGIYGPRFQQLGMTGAKLPGKIVADLLMNGFTATDYTGGTFFSTTHKHFEGGKRTFSNKGTKKLSAANYQTARAAIRGVKDEENQPLGVGDQLALIVSPAYEATARSIVLADTISGGGTNVNKGTAELIVLPQLSNAEDNWFLVDVGQGIGALILQEERPLELLTTATGQTTEQLLMTHTYLWQAYWRGNGGYGLPQLAWGSTGADAA
jgi:phage major head subunit gpT-like protein